MKSLSRGGVERKAMPQDPWVDPPVTFTVPLKKISDWELATHPKHPDRMLTPSLPVIDDETALSLEKVETEYVALIPYA